MLTVRHRLLLIFLGCLFTAGSAAPAARAYDYSDPKVIGKECMQEARDVFPVFHPKLGAHLVGARALTFKIKENPVQTLARDHGPSCEPVGNMSVSMRIGKQDAHGRLVFGRWVYILRHSNAAVDRWFTFPFRHRQPYRCKPGKAIEAWGAEIRRDAHYLGQPPMHDVQHWPGIVFDGYNDEC